MAAATPFQEPARMICVFVQVRCRPGTAYRVADAIALREFHSELYSTSGDYDLLAKLYIPDDQDVGRYINESFPGHRRVGADADHADLQGVLAAHARAQARARARRTGGGGPVIAVFLKTLPFFALIGLGFAAARMRVFPPEATAYLTKFVFVFALSAMLFSFAANLSLGAILDARFVAAYLAGTVAVYALATAVGFARGLPVAESAVEAQCAVIGNVGFLGLPMFVLLLGPGSAGPLLMVLATDLIVFSSLIVILVTGSRGAVGWRTVGTVAAGLARNPMIVSIAAGIAWSATGRPLWTPVAEFVGILGAAATPGALFAIGASLAGKSAERLSVAGWLTGCKLVLHPAAVALCALWLLPVADRDAAIVMIAAAALPVAGNVYMLAQHYGIAPQRVSTAILVSTLASILTVPVAIGLLTEGPP